MSWPSDVTFFSDADLGTRIFPTILRAAGVNLEILLYHFAGSTDDIHWIPIVANRGWVILTHDKNIRYNKLERNTVMQSGSRMIVIRGGADHNEMAQMFLDRRNEIIEFLQQNSGPFIAKLNRDKIETWLDMNNWTP